MCDELGDDETMTAYIEEYANTSLCSVKDGSGCDEREAGFIAKMKSQSNEETAVQLARLEKMEGDSMKPELMAWLKKRMKILRQLAAQDEL